MAQSKASATPGPWVHYDDSKESVHRHEIVALGKTVARIYCTKGMEAEDAANAALIVRAVNAYDDMLEALRASLVAMKLASALPGVSDEYNFGPAIAEAEAVLSAHLNTKKD